MNVFTVSETQEQVNFIMQTHFPFLFLCAYNSGLVVSIIKKPEQIQSLKVHMDGMLPSTSRYPKLAFF